MVIFVVICVCYRILRMRGTQKGRRSANSKAEGDVKVANDVKAGEFDVAGSGYFYHSCDQYPYRIVGRV